MVLAALVIPKGRCSLEVTGKGILVTSIEDAAETKILHTVFDVQVTTNGKTFKGFGEEDLKSRQPEAHAALVRICRTLPFDYAGGQVLVDPLRPAQQPVAEFLRDLQKSYQSLIDLIRRSGVGVELTDALSELDAGRSRRIEAARK